MINSGSKYFEKYQSSGKWEEAEGKQYLKT